MASSPSPYPLPRAERAGGAAPRIRAAKAPSGGFNARADWRSRGDAVVFDLIVPFALVIASAVVWIGMVR